MSHSHGPESANGEEPFDSSPLSRGADGTRRCGEQRSAMRRHVMARSDRQSSIVTGECGAREEWNDSLQLDAHGVSPSLLLSVMLSDWLATKDRRRLRLALVQLLLVLEAA